MTISRGLQWALINFSINWASVLLRKLPARPAGKNPLIESGRFVVDAQRRHFPAGALAGIFHVQVYGQRPPPCEPVFKFHGYGSGGPALMR